MTPGLRVSVQPAEPAIPIRFLYEELPNVYVFSAHKMFTTFCAPFPNIVTESAAVKNLFFLFSWLD